MRKDDEFIALLLLNQPALPDISISFTLQDSKTEDSNGVTISGSWHESRCNTINQAQCDLLALVHVRRASSVTDCAGATETGDARNASALASKTKHSIMAPG